MLVDEGLELLSEADCHALLAAGSVGRVGITIGALPAIFPVNYSFVNDHIVFRTAPGSKLAAASQHAVVAFEVDDYDSTDRTGWSVLAIGRAEVAHDLDLTSKALAVDLEPWREAGRRTSIVRIRPEFMSGRRIVRDDETTTNPRSNGITET